MTTDSLSVPDDDSGFGYDPGAAVAHLRACDAGLQRLIDAVGPFAMQIDKTADVFVALAESIVYQQLHGKAAATIFGRLVALMPSFTPAALLGLPDEAIRTAGLSRAKLLSVQDLAGRTLAGEIPDVGALRSMNDAAIIDCLTVVRGIGRWTVEMLLMFRLGRPDVLPIDDLGIRKGYALAYDLPDMPTRQDLARLGAGWAPYRTVASWYLWRAVDLAKRNAALSKE